MNPCLAAINVSGRISGSRSDQHSIRGYRVVHGVVAVVLGVIIPPTRGVIVVQSKVLVVLGVINTLFQGIARGIYGLFRGSRSNHTSCKRYSSTHGLEIPFNWGDDLKK